MEENNLDQRPLLTVDEAAQLLSLSAVTVRRLVRDRKLSVVRVGRTVRLTVDELHRFIRAQTEAAL